MLISYNWLDEMVPTGLGAYELSEKLTGIGLEIDGIHEQAGDVIFDIEVTSNRGDCLSHLGVAREVSAYFGKPVSIPEDSGDLPARTERVAIEDPDLCYRFTSRIVRGAMVGPSPDWLVSKLEAVGERSINNIADITNFVMHELGQPMHAFDLEKLKGQKIVVRRAVKDEKITTLDEEVRQLDESVLAICDSDKPVAVAGLMGGVESGVTESTTDILLEVACFDRDSIRKTSARLNLSTEASYRFERGVDIENLVRASNRASALMCELAGGTLDEFSDKYPNKQPEVSVEAENLPGELLRLTGIDIPKEKIDGYLQGLGFARSGDSVYGVPSWRHDISIPEDLVEEAARIHGYDQIDELLPTLKGAGEYHGSEPRKRRLRTVLANCGFDEAMSYSFIDQENASAYSTLEDLRSIGTAAVRIADPIIEGADLMRPTLLLGLLEAVRTNLSHKISDLRMFEIGRVFQGGEGSELPDEKELLAIVMTGRESFDGSAAPGRESDFFDLKAAVETAAEAVGIRELGFSASTDPKHLQDGQSALLSFDGKAVGSAGKLNSEIAKNYKFKQPVFVAELDLSLLLDEPEASTFYEPLENYPSVTRDVSIVVQDDINFAQIINVVETTTLDNFERASYVDTYSGAGIEDGERSITIRLEYRASDRTLTDEEVDSTHARALSALESKLDARFR